MYNNFSARYPAGYPAGYRISGKKIGRLSGNSVSGATLPDIRFPQIRPDIRLEPDI